MSLARRRCSVPATRSSSSLGRRQLLEDLAVWREDETMGGAPVRLWFVTASGGYGKTRLAVQACVEAETLGWSTGLLPPTPSDDNIRAAGRLARPAAACHRRRRDPAAAS